MYGSHSTPALGGGTGHFQRPSVAQMVLRMVSCIYHRLPDKPRSRQDIHPKGNVYHGYVAHIAQVRHKRHHHPAAYPQLPAALRSSSIAQWHGLTRRTVMPRVCSYEQELAHPLKGAVAGDLVQLMLIQVRNALPPRFTGCVAVLPLYHDVVVRHDCIVQRRAVACLRLLGMVVCGQVQFIKKELLVAMSAVDRLLQQNNFNLQVQHDSSL